MYTRVITDWYGLIRNLVEIENLMEVWYMLENVNTEVIKIIPIYYSKRMVVMVFNFLLFLGVFGGAIGKCITSNNCTNNKIYYCKEYVRRNFLC